MQLVAIQCNTMQYNYPSYLSLTQAISVAHIDGTTIATPESYGDDDDDDDDDAIMRCNNSMQ